MVSSDEGRPVRSEEKTPLPTTEQSNVHVYSDWAAMQAYYGPRVPMPPYFNSAVAPGHPPPPYMWGPPQAMLPPYGAPYAAIYSPGGVYAHPALPYGSHPPADGTSAAAAGGVLAGTTLSIDTPIKSSGNTDKGLVKKLKSFDGLAMSIGNGSSEKREGTSSENRSSQSGESEGSSDASDGKLDEAEGNARKRIREETPVAASNEKSESKTLSLVDGKVRSSGGKVLGIPVSTENGTGVISSTSVATTLELSNPGVNAKENPATIAPMAMMSSESWMQNEREQKRERRKQSNRESARRSRLRKQAETEELAKRVDSLTSENIMLKAEVSQLVEKTEKLQQENSKLMKWKKSESSQRDEMVSREVRVEKNCPPINTENLLSRVNNSLGRSAEEGGGGGVDVYQKGTNSGAKLHQLLDASPRADAVTAG